MHAMHGRGLGGVDLNLLVALDSLLSERNVTHAAKRIGLTQSAMSHALARLRALFDDALLVRSASGLLLTARAEALVPVVRHVLDEIQRALEPAVFDPATATGRLVLGTSDYAELVLLPRLVARVAEEAPNLDLRAILMTDVGTMLASGQADVIITSPGTFTETTGLRKRHLFDESFVCVVRKEHPLAKKKMTLERFTSSRHALIAPRGTEGSFVDDALARQGRARRVSVTVPHFLIAPHVVAASDLILTLAERVARVLTEPLGLVSLAPPPELALQGFSMATVWHDRSHGDPMRKWLRDMIAETAKDA